MVSPGRPIVRLMKSRSGSSGNLNTMTSPRRMARIGIRIRSSELAVGAKMNLLTSRWSPTSRFGSIEPVGILKACTTNVRMNSARMTATTIDSKYSRTVDFRNVASAIFPHLQYRQERLLRNIDLADPFHAAFAFLLLLQQFALARDVAAVA